MQLFQAFRTSSSWETLPSFPCTSVRPFPFEKRGNKIIYATDYENIENVENGGIFEYDMNNNKHKTIILWKDLHFDLVHFTMIYDESQDCIIFVGGKKFLSHQFNIYLKKITIFDMKNVTLQYIDIDVNVGENPRLALSNNDNCLHIVGGFNNDLHLIYNLKQNELKTGDSNPKIYGHALIYSKRRDIILMFGGYSSLSQQYSDNFWILNTDKGSNDKWILQNKKKLIKKISWFGYILYDDRIIITFGGKAAGKRIDNIYYIDITNDNGWKQSKIKCVKSGGCHAVLVRNKRVHIMPYSDYNDHYVIDIGDILPQSMLIKDDIKDDMDNGDNLIEENDKLKNEIKLLMKQNVNLRETNNKLIEEHKEMEMKYNDLNLKYIALRYVEWSSDDVIDWILSLDNKRFAKYEKTVRVIFEEQEINGSCLNAVSKTDLNEWGILNVKDKDALFAHIQDLINRKHSICSTHST